MEYFAIFLTFCEKHKFCLRILCLQKILYFEEYFYKNKKSSV